MRKLQKRFLMSEGRRTQIVLLDGRELDIVVQPRLSVDELLNIVASHCHLKDPDKQYFGLAFYDEKHQCHWLQSERRVLDHEFPRKFTISGATLVLYHLIKLFVDSITHLVHSSSVELFFLHAAAQVYKGLIDVDSDSVFQLGAYLLQAYYGDYSNINTARNNLKRLPVFSSKTLKEFSSVASCEDHVIDIYKTLNGITKGQAIVNYMELAEKLHTYGVHFYEIKDKAGISYNLGISSKGIYQYDLNDRTKPLKGYQWKQLENLYYRDKKFSVEVHESKRVVHTLSSFNLYEDAMREPLDVSDELTAAVCDPTTQVSVSRRAFIPSNIHVHVYFCDTPQLCKTMWSLTICQHQFYLDRRSNKKIIPVHNTKELAAKLTQSLTMVGSNHKSSITGSRNDNSSTSDLGSSISSQSLQSMPSTTSVERTEEDKRRDAEYSKQLKNKKMLLEQLLTEKLKELKDVCVKEGSITGELPAEIKRALVPGEAEPKIQRRVGTAFTIPLDIVGKQTKADQIARFEADIEIQRKIVTAALKLANDVTVNKMVRRKRRRDYQTANLRLRELEQHLHQLRLSSSKPDLPNVHLDKFVSNGSLTKSLDGPLRITKSAPNTPRGSVSDLTEVSSNGDSQDIVYRPTSKSVVSHKPPLSHRPPNLPVAHRAYLPPHMQQERALHHSSSFPADPRLLSSSLPSTPQICSNVPNDSNVAAVCDPSVLFRNEPAGGYRSHAPYQSSYRTQRYPTLNSSGSNGQLNNSTGELNVIAAGSSQNSSMQSLASSCDYDILPPFQRYNKCSASTAIDHQIGAYNIPNQRTSWDYECLNQMSSAAILGSSESLDAVAAACQTSRYIAGGGGVHPIRPPRPVGVTSHCYTGSLDRRVLKQRQKEKWRKLGVSTEQDEPPAPPPSSSSSSSSGGRDNNKPSGGILIENVVHQLDHSPTRYGPDVARRSASVSSVPGQQHPPTYFNGNLTAVLNAAVGRKMSANELSSDHLSSSYNTIGRQQRLGSVELTKPFETSDVLKYSERSTNLHNGSSSGPIRSPSHLSNSSSSSSPSRSAAGSRLQRQNLATSDLLTWFDDKDKTKTKPATIV